MACLDTVTLLDLARPRGGTQVAAKRMVRRMRDEGEILTTTRLNVAELLVGVARSPDPARERRKVESLLRPLVILEFDAPSAETFGRIVGHLLARGEPIGDLDALIASVCLSAGHRIVTRNVRHFSRIPGLRVESY